MQEILPDVFMWSYRPPDRQVDVNGWYLAGGEPAVVDPVPCTDADVEEIARRGMPVAIILTNKGHIGDSERFARRFCAPVLVHRGDAPLTETRIGGVFKSGDRLPGGLEAIRVAGARSPGECALLLRRVNAIILGDALIGAPAGKVEMRGPEAYADPLKAREGVANLLRHPFEALLLGSGTPIPVGGRKAIREYLDRTGG